MRNFLIAVNRYYNKYKFLIWVAIVAIVLFWLVSYGIEKFQRENNSNNSSSANNTTTVVADNSIPKTDEQRISEVTDYNSAIKTFMNFCNEKKISTAYSMLSDDCKEVLYPSEDLFEKNYYNVYFQEFRNVSIAEYNKNGTYQVTFKTDSLSTGSEPKVVNKDYITVDTDNKLNVLGFIKKSNVNKTASDLYLKAEVIEKNIYLDHEDYKVQLSNQTSADMILDNLQSEATINLVDGNNNYYNLDVLNYNESDFSINAGKTKTITFKFAKAYKGINDENSESTKIIFRNINIENYEYGDITSVDENTSTTYERKTTKYPETIIFQIELI